MLCCKELWESNKHPESIPGRLEAVVRQFRVKVSLYHMQGFNSGHINLWMYIFSCLRWGWLTSTLQSCGASLVAQTVKHLSAMQETWVWSLGWEDPLEKEMAVHSSILAWKIPWTLEPGRLPSMGSQRAGHDWATSLHPVLDHFLPLGPFGLSFYVYSSSQ